MTRSLLHRSTARRATAALLAAVTAVALPACSEDDPEAFAGDERPDVRGADDLDDVYNGPYSADFREDLDGYEGQEITLEGSVDEVVSSVAFALGAVEGEDVEPLLVVLDGASAAPEAGEDVVVAGVPQEDFDAGEVGAEIDGLGDESAYEEWDGEPYLRATIVEPAPAGG